ncbi:MAG TPA: PIG-L family deacetylase [bacterium]|nr:PIG-L family deacetylase [bacterium]HPN29661.1 PIG-L family deacetylase [bacterium]
MKLLIKKFLDDIIALKKIRLLKRYYSNISPNPVELESISGDNILILVPHPDDEIIGCGGLILRMLEQKKKIFLLYSSNAQTIRIEELKRVNKVLGTDYLVNSSYYRKTLKELIEKLKPEAVILPNFIDNHPEHFKISEELYFILKNRSDLEFKILMYEIWSPHQPNIIIDITKHIETKINLLKLYASQLINKDYVNIVKGLNSYRAAYLSKPKNNSEEILYAESFVLIQTTGEFVNMYEYVFNAL